MKTFHSHGKDFFKDIDYFFMHRSEEKTRDSCIYHSHDFLEICYVASGSGYHLVADKQYRVYKGDLFIINYNIYHTFIKENPEDDLSIYNIIIKPGFIENGLLDLNDFNSETLSYIFEDIDVTESDSLKLKEDIRLTIQEQYDFDRLLDNMYNEYKLKQEGYVNIIKAYIIELIVKIMRCFSQRSGNDKSLGKKTQTICNIIDFLNKNYSQGFTLKELAVNSFFSKNYLCKLFRKITGMTISEYLQKIRTEHACQLLALTDKKVTDIAYEVGFSDYKSFNSTFKRIKGMLPKEYRKIASGS